MKHFAKVSSLAIALALSASMASAADSNFNGNPAARGATTRTPEPGTHVPGATGTNPYSGRSVGEPLHPNDLGTPQQNAKEKYIPPKDPALK